jgi:hypothetical protein
MGSILGRLDLRGFCNLDRSRSKIVPKEMRRELKLKIDWIVGCLDSLSGRSRIDFVSGSQM